MDKPQKLKLQPFDYVVLFLVPLVFILLAWWGIRSLLGPVPKADPVVQLRDGKVKPGMSEGEVLQVVGDPKSRFERETGSYVFRYSRGVWDAEHKTFSQEDADIEFNGDGIVSSVKFDTQTPPTPK